MIINIPIAPANDQIATDVPVEEASLGFEFTTVFQDIAAAEIQVSTEPHAGAALAATPRATNSEPNGGSTLSKGWPPPMSAGIPGHVIANVQHGPDGIALDGGVSNDVSTDPIEPELVNKSEINTKTIQPAQIIANRYATAIGVPITEWASRSDPDGTNVPDLKPLSSPLEFTATPSESTVNAIRPRAASDHVIAIKTDPVSEKGIAPLKPAFSNGAEPVGHGSGNISSPETPAATLLSDTVGNVPPDQIKTPNELPKITPEVDSPFVEVATRERARLTMEQPGTAARPNTQTTQPAEKPPKFQDDRPVHMPDNEKATNPMPKKTVLAHAAEPFHGVSINKQVPRVAGDQPAFSDPTIPATKVTPDVWQNTNVQKLVQTDQTPPPPGTVKSEAALQILDVSSHRKSAMPEKSHSASSMSQMTPAVADAQSISMQPAIVASPFETLQFQPLETVSLGLSPTNETAMDGKTGSSNNLANATPQHYGPRVVAAISQAATMLQDRPVELLLNPEELGRVRLTLTSSDGSMSVSVAVERPETLDLLRRHIDILSTELRDIGYQNLTFEFARDDGKPTGDNRAENQDGGGQSNLDGSPKGGAPVSAVLNISADAAVDIRL